MDGERRKTKTSAAATAWPSLRQPLYFAIDRQTNQRGNRVAARAIGAVLLENDSRP